MTKLDLATLSTVSGGCCQQQTQSCGAGNGGYGGNGGCGGNGGNGGCGQQKNSCCS